MFESFFGKKPAVETEVKVEELTTEQYDKKMEDFIHNLSCIINSSDPEIEDQIVQIDMEARKILDKTSHPDLNLRKLNSLIQNMNPRY
ncbi:MAG: hypothetical protein WAV11_00655 [Minisyncoccia bacterium]